MSDGTNDLVISYIVGPKEVIESTYEPLKKALDNGYRVVDFIPTPIAAGGAAIILSHCVVTVLLTNKPEGLRYHGKASVKAGMA